jgi:hypothetical protein
MNPQVVRIKVAPAVVKKYSDGSISGILDLFGVKSNSGVN